MAHLFSQIPRAEIQRSSFDRSHTYKTAMNENYLVPFFVDEVLPGDTFNLKASLFGRLATPAVPVLDNLYLDTFFFFVPTRLVWSNWQKFNGEQENPGDSTSHSRHQITCRISGIFLLTVEFLPIRPNKARWHEKEKSIQIKVIQHRHSRSREPTK